MSGSLFGCYKRRMLMKEVILTQEQLEERLAYWQEKLRLRDWIISIRKGTPKEVGKDASANVQAIFSNKSASILVLHEEQYPSIEGEGFPRRRKTHG